MKRSNESLVPRNGHTLVVAIVARISGCEGQKEMSLDDQVDHARGEVDSLYEGETDYRIIQTKNKGEWLKRPELTEIERQIRTAKLDLLIMEDVGRLIRGADAVRLWGIAVDHGTRCIAPHDCLDTTDETWEEDLIAACRDHVGHNAHTSRRIKKKLMNRFKKGTGATSRPIAGYVVPDDAKTFDDWQKDESATPIIQNGLKRLKDTKNCSAVADYFNQIGFKPGPYCRRSTWNGAMVRRFYGNRLLAGRPGRGFRHTVKHHETGRRVSVKNEKTEPTFLDYPHLAHLELGEIEELIHMLGERNSRYRRPDADGVDPLRWVPRKRTRFLGQHAHCWYCGRECVWGGNGVTDHLMCNGSRDYRCWNSVGFSGPELTAKLVDLIMDELTQLDGFDEQFQAMLASACDENCGASEEQWRQLQQDEKTLQREQANLMDAVAQFGSRPMLAQKLKELEDRQKQLARQRYQLEAKASKKLELPQSVDELRALLHDQFQQLAADSYEFGDLMRLLVPDVKIYLVRLCDGGHLLPRAKVKLQLGGIVPDVQQVPALEKLLTRELTIDVFTPPQRERVREESVALRKRGLKCKQIAAEIAEKPTSTAVQRALALQAQMDALGLDTPYQLLLDPPDDYRKLRRHKNAKYRFEMREGYERPEL